MAEGTNIFGALTSVRRLDVLLREDELVCMCDRDVDSEIASAENELNLLYTRARQRLSQTERDGLKNDEIKWITKKDSLQATQELSAIQERIRIFQQKYGN